MGIIKPKKIEQIYFNKNCAKRLIDSILCNKHKIILVYGSTGCGKTLAKNIVIKKLGCKSYDYDDNKDLFTKKDKKILDEINRKSLFDKNINSKKSKNSNKIITIDNFEEKDEKDIKIIRKIIKITGNIKILIITNKKNRYYSELNKNKKCINIIFDEITDNKIDRFLDYVKRKVDISDKIKETIIKQIDKDINKLIMLIREYRTLKNKKIKEDNIIKILKKNDKKDVENNIFEATKKIIKDDNNIENKIDEYYKEREIIPLLMYENYIRNIRGKKNIKELKEIIDSISKGDIIDKYIREYNDWDLIDTHGIYSCVIPSYYIRSVKKNKIFLTYPKKIYVKK